MAQSSKDVEWTTGRVGDLAARVTRWIGDARIERGDALERGDAVEHGDTAFDALVLEAFRLQHTRVPAFRRLCDARGVGPEDVARDGWRAIPPVPVAAFRELALHVAPPREIFRSSGTTSSGGAQSVHHHPFPDLYRAVIDASFAAACMKGERQRPLLALVPSRAQAPDSSLSFMVDHVLARHGAEGSVTAFGEAGVEVEAAEAFVAARAADGRPATVLATAFALAQWLEPRPLGAPHLPSGSTVFETGGFKGRHRELSRDELLELLAARLGVPGRHVVREYGMTELTGHVYTRVLAARGAGAGDGDLFVPPPWMRVRALDPASLDEMPAGVPGLAAILDLANVGSALRVLTEDQIVCEGADRRGAFRLLGRAPGAMLRGCSLTVEELFSAVDGD